MEKIGSINNLLILATMSYEKGLLLKQTDLGQSRISDIKAEIKIIKTIGKTKDISEIINAERFLLRHEMNVYGKDDLIVHKSFSEAINELEKASKLLPIVYNKDKYSLVNDGISDKTKYRKDGLPKDSFHVFVNSHQTRLSNRIRTAEISFEERQLLTERHSNMKVFEFEFTCVLI